MKDFLHYCFFHKRAIALFVLFSVVFLIFFLLYHLPVTAVLYPAAFCILAGGTFAAVDFSRSRDRHRTLILLTKNVESAAEHLPAAQTWEAQDYQQMVSLLCQRCKQVENSMNLRYTDMIDYYTVWAHQIKTPIASMRLMLQNEDSDLARDLSADLLRIEQYVQMVLCYLRLDSDSTDYVFRQCDLDRIVRQAVRKFAGPFIRKKIRLNYDPICVRVLTDEKWLLFVLEQILSNALKYTQTGQVRIFLEEPKTLCIQDTGIGIAPEDLPRVFEKGYTGYNGRFDQRASGIGLYLSSRICRNLGHGLRIQSVPGKGTTVRIDLDSREMKFE